MEKRVLIAVILSFIVLYAYQAMYPPPRPSPAGGTSTPKTSTAPPSAATSTVPPATPPAGSTQQPAEALPSSAAAPVVADSAERDITVENSAVSAVFATRGAVLKSWRLKKYPDSAGQPLELVPHTVPEGTSRPFTLSVGDQPTDSELSSALFKPSADRVDVTSGTSTLTFEYTHASGLAAKKDFVFSANQPYAVDFSSTVSRSGKALQPTVHWGPGIGSGVV